MTTILHLGLGAFHRAHQARSLNRLIALGERDWTLVAGNLAPFAGDASFVAAVRRAYHARHGNGTR